MYRIIVLPLNPEVIHFYQATNTHKRYRLEPENIESALFKRA